LFTAKAQRAQRKIILSFALRGPTDAVLISRPGITGLIKYLCGLCVFAVNKKSEFCASAVRLNFNRSADFLQMLAKSVGRIFAAFF
jgi:hypothetical protein